MKRKPIRMCTMCRQRAPQGELLRLQIDADKLKLFTQMGRSFYICSTCGTNEKKINGFSKRYNIEKNIVENMFKESFING